MTTTVNLRHIFTAHDDDLEAVPTEDIEAAIAELLPEIRGLAATAEQRDPEHRRRARGRLAQGCPRGGLPVPAPAWDGAV